MSGGDGLDGGRFLNGEFCVGVEFFRVVACGAGWRAFRDCGDEWEA